MAGSAKASLLPRSRRELRGIDRFAVMLSIDRFAVMLSIDRFAVMPSIDPVFAERAPFLTPTSRVIYFPRYDEMRRAISREIPFL